jgi:hypothetical protein
LDYEIGDEAEKVYKKAFVLFYRWIMRNIYPIYVLKSNKIQNKVGYLRRKNELVHLPDAEKKMKRIRKNASRTASLSVSN